MVDQLAGEQQRDALILVQADTVRKYTWKTKTRSGTLGMNGVYRGALPCWKQIWEAPVSLSPEQGVAGEDAPAWHSACESASDEAAYVPCWSHLWGEFQLQLLVWTHLESLPQAWILPLMPSCHHSG